MLYGRDSISFEDAKAALSSRELKKKVSDGLNDTESHGLVIRGRDSERSYRGNLRAKSQTRKGLCNYCHKPGHWKTECPRLKDKGKSFEKSANADDANFVDEEFDFAFALFVGNSFFDGWLLDSACSHHMCFNRDWFDTYRSTRSVVFIGDHTPCEVMGIGTVRIEMHDGIIRTLTNVRHVPDLQNNLISLGTLDSQGYKFASEGGVLRVSDGACVVIQGKLIGNKLYELQGSTITSASLVASSSIGSDIDIVNDVFVEDHGFCEDWIVRHRTTWMTPHIKIAEHDCGFLIEKACSMLSVVNWYKKFGAEFVSSCYMENWSPSSAFVLKTPIEVWFGNTADYLQLVWCPFGALVSDGKLERRIEKFVVHGFDLGVNQLWCVQLKSPKFVISKDLEFEEYAILCEGESVGAGSDHGVSKQVELLQALVEVSDYTSIQPSQGDMHGFVGDIEEKQLWFYNVALCEEIWSLRRSHHIWIMSVPVGKFKHCLSLFGIRN